METFGCRVTTKGSNKPDAFNTGIMTRKASKQKTPLGDNLNRLPGSTFTLHYLAIRENGGKA